MTYKSHSLSDGEIRKGKNTDVYFLRTQQILKTKGIRKQVIGEVRASALPGGGEWGVLSGIDEVVSLLEGLPIDLFGLPEGTPFEPGTPVLVIQGDYLSFGIHETSLLGMLCQASGIATKASRFRRIAGENLLVSFGARRMHPKITPLIDRSAYIGGVDGVSSVTSAERLGLDAKGTMPHALILLAGDTVEAARNFHETIPPSVPRVVLVDTYNDEKFEALRVAEDLGRHLFAVRLDTPGSRRGDFLEICKEVRWELDLRGYRQVRIFVSGGLDEEDVRRLSSVADSFGIGTSLSNAPSVDFSLDLVEIEGEPVSKKGKLSGRKNVFRCDECLFTDVTPHDSAAPVCPQCDHETRSIIVPLLKKGKRVRKPKSPKSIRKFVLDELRKLPPL